MKKLTLKRMATLVAAALVLTSISGIAEVKAEEAQEELVGYWSASTNDYSEYTGGYGYTASTNDYQEVVEDNTPAFDDVETGKWYTDSISYVNKTGIMTGYKGSNDFGVDDNLTRAQFAAIIYRLAGSPTPASAPDFDDVPEGYYFTDPIAWCSQNGIVTGYKGTKLFGTNDNISRQELATMLYRLATLQGRDVNNLGTLAGYADFDQASAFAANALGWCTGKGIITGKKQADESYLLDPQGRASRAECATMIYRYMTK